MSPWALEVSSISGTLQDWMGSSIAACCSATVCPPSSTRTHWGATFAQKKPYPGGLINPLQPLSLRDPKFSILLFFTSHNPSLGSIFSINESITSKLWSFKACTCNPWTLTLSLPLRKSNLSSNRSEIWTLCRQSPIFDVRKTAIGVTSWKHSQKSRHHQPRKKTRWWCWVAC